MNTDLKWFKSSYSGSQGGECLEIAISETALLHIRDSKTPAAPILTVAPATWSAFLPYAATYGSDQPGPH
ncbi:DUF397 domain-containing protein [Streptomyces sp. DSM 40484]|jgi:hypothetical protein|uniref:DUF397 domain-containing protein n=1 Tax=Streptomyces kroppenstedtii TaxID=3051181 RepID=UPI0028D5BB8F|nr:DUF397 domain-containing protein [Streptomyces sp. DSM 40484]